MSLPCIDKVVVSEGGVQGVVKKWGNSAAVRIPAAVLEAAQVHLDQPVDVREEGGRIVIEPIRPPRYEIGALIAAITDENRHDPVEMGNPVGGEVW
jgi:antitoxin MazE